MVGMRSMRWAGALSITFRRRNPAGQCTMQGVLMPPSCE